MGGKNGGWMKGVKNRGGVQTSLYSQKMAVN